MTHGPRGSAVEAIVCHRPGAETWEEFADPNLVVDTDIVCRQGGTTPSVTRHVARENTLEACDGFSWTR